MFPTDGVVLDEDGLFSWSLLSKSALVKKTMEIFFFFFCRESVMQISKIFFTNIEK